MIRSIFLRALGFVALWWILAEGRLDGWLLGRRRCRGGNLDEYHACASGGSCAYVLPG